MLVLLCVSAGRWLWAHTGATDEPLATSILPELVDAVAVAALDEEQRRRPLADGERIDPNRASEADLDRLPGIGPSIARSIVVVREAGTVYRSEQDLAAVRGIGPALLGRIRPFVEFGSPHAVSPARSRASRPERALLVDINRAGLDELVELPGIGPVIAEQILQKRRDRPFRTVDDLLDVRGIGPATLERLRGSIGVGGRR